MRWETRGVRGTGVTIHQSSRAGKGGSRQGKEAHLSKEADPPGLGSPLWGTVQHSGPEKAWIGDEGRHS